MTRLLRLVGKEIRTYLIYTYLKELGLIARLIAYIVRRKYPKEDRSVSA